MTGEIAGAWWVIISRKNKQLNRKKKADKGHEEWYSEKQTQTFHNVWKDAHTS